IRMTLWNDFTHFLDDPINGDQEEQDDERTTLGGAAAFRLTHSFGSIDTETVGGLQARYDNAYVDRRHTLRRQALNYCEVGQPDGPAIPTPAPTGACNADDLKILDLGPYVENTIHWTPWLRTIVGFREEYYYGKDHSLVTGFSGSGHETLFQPKGSIVLG